MTPETEVVKVDMEREVLRMAQADGITDPNQLKMKLVVIRREYYETTIRAYYRGVDHGFADGAAAIGKPFSRDLRSAFFAGLLLGVGLVGASWTVAAHYLKPGAPTAVEGR